MTLFILPGGCPPRDRQATANSRLQAARKGAFPPSPTPGLSLFQPILGNSLPILFSRLPPLTATKTSTPRKTSIRAPWNALSTRERVSKVKVKATKSPSVKKTKGPRLPLLQESQQKLRNLCAKQLQPQQRSQQSLQEKEISKCCRKPRSTCWTPSLTKR